MKMKMETRRLRHGLEVGMSHEPLDGGAAER